MARPICSLALEAALFLVQWWNAWLVGKGFRPSRRRSRVSGSGGNGKGETIMLGLL